MKLIKIVGKISDNFNTPLVERVTEFFPRDLESTMENEYIIVSDSKFRLLEFNHVRMHVYKEFSETVAHNLEKFLKDDYYVIKEVIKPSEFDETLFDPSEYDEDDILFFYAESPVKPEEPEKPKFHEGTFNYELTPEKKKELMDEYEEALAAYNTALEAYNTSLETFMTNEADLPIFGCLGVIINEIMIGKKLEILWDVSFETTKTEAQFGVLGKLPKEVATKVGSGNGGIKTGDSIRKMTISDILVKMLGLEKEEEVVGVLQPNENSAKGMSRPTIDYGTDASGKPKTALGGPNDTATISTTLSLPEDTEATTIKLVNSKTGEVVNSKSISSPDAEVSFDVTGLTESTKFTIVAVHEETDPDSGETTEVVDGKSSTTVAVKIVKPTLGALSATPSTVDSTSTPVEFQITVNEGSAAITSVKLYTSADVEVGSMTPIDLNDNVYGYTLNSVTETAGYYVKAVDANGSEKKSNTVTVTLTMTGPNGTLSVSSASITTVSNITINATATAGSSVLAKVEFFVDNTLEDTVTENFTPENLTWEDENVEATTEYKIVITDANNLTKTITKTVTFTVQNPVITMTAAPTTITTKKDNITLTINATKKSFDLTKIELFEGATATGTALETWTTDLTTTKTHTIADVNTNKTYTVKVTDAKNNTATASASVTYSYVHPTLTVNSVTPTSTDNPITPSSVVTVSVTSTAQTGATGSTIKLYRVRSGADTLIDTIAYASPASFTVSGGHADGDKFKAVVEYTADGDSYSAQKTSSAIHVEVPPAQIYHINVMGIEPFLTSNGALVDDYEDPVKVLPTDLTTSIVTTAINDASLVTNGVVKKYTPIIGEISAPMSTTPVGTEDPQNLLQQAFLIPQSFAHSDVIFYQNSSAASIDSTMKNNHSTVVIDGITYDVYVNGGILSGALTYRIVLE